MHEREILDIVNLRTVNNHSTILLTVTVRLQHFQRHSVMRVRPLLGVCV